MPFVSTSRGDIYYKDYRSSDFEGVPYVMVHGAGSQYMDYHSKMRRGLPSIVLDLPGHGRSPKIEQITIENYAKSVIALLDALNIAKIILVGHSMGGAIAQQIALDYPQYLHGLILIATGANLIVNDTIINGIVEKPEETAYLVTKWSWGEVADEKLLQQGVEHLLQTDVNVIQADYIACDNFDVRARLHEIQVPTLVIAGAQDKMVQLAWTQELAEKIHNSNLTIFEESGHQVHVENVDEVITVITDWAQKL